MALHMTSSLSILIPVYDRDVRELLTSLVAMRHDWSGPLEILLLDDASGEEFRALNRELGSWPSVTYRELPHNVGRAKPSSESNWTTLSA